MIEQNWEVYATVGQLALRLPASRVEEIGFHESNHDGAQRQEPVDIVRTRTLESRDRDTDGHGAADIVVDPAVEIRSPVSGVVKRAGGYTLYCDHRDFFAVIEPDIRAGWEVKVLHLTGMLVRPGDRVEAGVTVLAPGARVLPFTSQVDEFTGEPSWPHVHIEVVDPSIPDRPGSGGGC